MKKGKLRVTEDGMLCFYCPACKRMHGVYVDESKLVNWGFNGDYDKPTFSPSIKVEMWNHPDKSDICHSFVRNGKIQYLSDCTHDLAGQTVDMVDPDFDE
jgi:hypothetical protein